MKQLYFTPESIDLKARELLRNINVTQNRGRSSFVPDHSALLILDMQSYFLDETSHAFVPSAKAILPRLVELSKAYRSRGLPIIFTQHLNTQHDAGLMATWWRELILPDHPLRQIVADFDLYGCPIVNKSQYDAFYNTALDTILRDLEVNQIVISGVMTHLCCETTARSAFMHGFEVLFLVDGTATYNEAFHLSSMINLSHGFASLKLVSDIQASLTDDTPYA
jgi:isochorismate hydrolase